MKDYNKDCLAIKIPELVREWNIEKNKELTPYDVSCGSGIKVWWKCSKEECGHEWQTKISHRTDRHGCPKCARKLASETYKTNKLKKYGSLKDTHPEIAKEWHPIKNGDLTIENVHKGVTDKVWWQHSIEKDGKIFIHEWEAPISNRTKKNGTNCPYCANQKVQEGFNDLLTTHPLLSLEFDESKNNKKVTDVIAGSNKKYWWKCTTCNHEWEATLSSRSYNGNGCSQCVKDRSISFNEKVILFYLKKIFKNIKENYTNEWLGKRELDIFIPELKLAIEYDGEVWHKKICKDIQKNELCEQHEITLIRIREPKCPKLNSLSIDYILKSYEEKELENSIRFIIDYINTTYKYSFDIDVDTSRDRIKIYELMKLSQKENSFESWCKNNNRIDFLEEWNFDKNGNIKPDMISHGSAKYVWWRCKECGYEWEDSTHNRIQGKKCFNCRCLEIKNPELSKEWHPTKNGDLNPSNVLANAHRKVWWLGKCNHEWKASVYSRNSGSKCPYCNNKKILKGFNDLQSQYPDIAKEWNYEKNENILPDEILKGSNTKVWWKHQVEKNGILFTHEWEAKVVERINGAQCPYCTGHKVLAGFNDLETEYPELIKEWDDKKNSKLSPREVSSGSDKKVWWITKDGKSKYLKIYDKVSSEKRRLKKIELKYLPVKNNISELYPELVKEWHPTKNGDLKPYMYTKGSEKKVWWQIEVEKEGKRFLLEWEASIINRVKGRGCPYISKSIQKILEGFNDLATTHPEVAKEWHPTKNGDKRPQDISAGCNVKYWWIDCEGNEFERTPNERTRLTRNKAEIKIIKK